MVGRKWTNQEISILKELYPRSLNRNLVAVFNRRSDAIKQKASRLSITKIPEVYRKQAAKTLSKTRKRLFREGNLKPWNKGIPRSEKVKRELSKRMKAHWRDPKFAKRAKQAINKSPNIIERRVIDICKKYDFPFQYVGDGSLWLDGLNPDFIATDNTKKVIEVFGRTYHDPTKSFFKIPPLQTEPIRKAKYSQLGYSCLVIWDRQLVDTNQLPAVIKKIRRFVEEHG